MIESLKKIAEINNLMEEKSKNIAVLEEKIRIRDTNNYSSEAKIKMEKTLTDLVAPTLNYTVPIQQDYEELKESLNLILIGSKFQKAMFEIEINETTDINNKYQAYLFAATGIINQVKGNTAGFNLPSTSVMENIITMSNQTENLNAPYTDYSTEIVLCVGLREDLYNALKTYAEDIQQIAGVGQDVSSYDTLIQLTPTIIDRDIYLTTELLVVSETPFPIIVEATNITTQDYADLETQLKEINDFSATITEIMTQDFISKLPTFCFDDEKHVFTTKITALTELFNVSTQYVVAMSYLKTREILTTAVSQITTDTVAEQQKFLVEQNKREIGVCLNGMYLIHVNTADTKFKNEKSRNIKIAIPAKKNGLFYVAYDGSQYSKTGMGLNCTTLCELDFYETDTLRHLSTTYYKNDVIEPLEIKSVKNNNGKITLSSTNKTVYLEDCYFTNKQMTGFGLTLPDQYMEGFFLGKSINSTEDKYIPGYYLVESGKKINLSTTSIEPYNDSYRERNTTIPNLLGYNLSYIDGNTVESKVTMVNPDDINETIKEIAFENGTTKSIVDVFATSIQMQIIDTVVKENLVFCEEKKLAIHKGNDPFRNITIYLPSIRVDANTAKIPLLNRDSNDYKKFGHAINSNLKSNYSITYFDNENASSEYHIGRLEKVVQKGNGDDYGFMVIVEDGSTKEFDMNQCFFTKYQWSKIQNEEYNDLEEFFIGLCVNSTIPSLNAIGRPLYLPGYYYIEGGDKKYKFFMGGDYEEYSNNYSVTFHAINALIGKNISYLDGQDIKEGVSNRIEYNDNDTIKSIEIGGAFIPIETIIVEQYQISEFYSAIPAIEKLKNLKLSNYFPRDLDRNIEVWKFEDNQQGDFVITLKKGGYEITTNKKTKDKLYVADKDDVYEIVSIFALDEFVSIKTTVFFTDTTGRKHKMEDIFLYQHEYNRLRDNKTPNTNGLVGFYLQLSTINGTYKNTDFETTVGNDSYLPGYQFINNESVIFAMNDKITTTMEQPRVIKFIGNPISFENGTGWIDSYQCDDKDNITDITIKTSRNWITPNPRVTKGISECYYTEQQKNKYYSNYDSLETYLTSNTVVLFKVLITETSFVNNGRPISIYVPGSIYSQNGSSCYSTFNNTPVSSHNVSMSLIKDNEFLQKIFFNGASETALQSMEYKQQGNGMGIFLNGTISLSEIYVTSSQLYNNAIGYTLGNSNAIQHFCLFMINSETIAEYNTIITEYSYISTSDELFLFGYYFERYEVGEKIRLFVNSDTIEATVVTKSKLDYQDNMEINVDGYKVVINEFIHNDDLITGVSHADADGNNVISKINKCYYVPDVSDDNVVINYIPIKMMKPSEFETLFPTEETVIDKILTGEVLTTLDEAKLLVIIDKIDVSKIQALPTEILFLFAIYPAVWNVLKSKITEQQKIQLFKYRNTENKTIPSNATDLSGIGALADNLDLITGNLTSKEISNLIEPIDENIIDALVTNPANITFAMPDVAKINTDLKDISPKYLRLLMAKSVDINKLHTLVGAIDNDLTEEQINVIKSVVTREALSTIANKVVDKLDAKKLGLLLQSINDDDLFEVLMKADEEKIVDVLNENPEILNKILGTDDGANNINELNDKIKNTVAALKLNKAARDNGISVDTLLPVTDVNLIDDDLFVEKFNQIASAGLKIQYITRIQNELESLSPKKIAALIKDSGVDERAKLFGNNEISNFDLDDINKLITGDASWLVNLIKPEDLIKMEPDNIDALRTKFQAQWNDIVKDITAEQIIGLDADKIDAIQTGLTDEQWNNIVKDITADQIIGLDAAEITAIRQQLTHDQWNEIAKKISTEQIIGIDAAKIEAIKEGVGNVDNWYAIVKDITPQQIFTLNAAKINLIKDGLSEEQWDSIVTKMESRDVHNLTTEQINAIRSFALLEKLRGTSIQSLQALSDEKKQAIRHILQLNNNLSHEEKLALGYRDLTNGALGMGGKTKRSKVKQNKTRRL